MAGVSHCLAKATCDGRTGFDLVALLRDCTVSLLLPPFLEGEAC